MLVAHGRCPSYALLLVAPRNWHGALATRHVNLEDLVAPRRRQKQQFSNSRANEHLAPPATSCPSLCAYTLEETFQKVACSRLAQLSAKQQREESGEWMSWGVAVVAELAPTVERGEQEVSFCRVL